MNYRKGDRVRHPTKADWDVGEVLEGSNGSTVRVFFVGAGEKELSLQHVELTKVSGPEADHPILDQLRLRKTSSGIKYQSLAESIQYFLAAYPQGFFGEKFATEERNYKVHAHQLAEELLGRRVFKALLDAGEFAGICKRALQVVNATNLIFPNEKMALNDGLDNDEARQLFALKLFDLLYGEATLEERFKGFSTALENIGAAKWTTATYFLFIVHPDKFMFVKPTITQNAAELCGYEINYKPELNWLTYKLVLEFSEYLRNGLKELQPRDMIDVQSFLWCIAHAPL